MLWDVNTYPCHVPMKDTLRLIVWSLTLFFRCIEVKGCIYIWQCTHEAAPVITPELPYRNIEEDYPGCTVAGVSWETYPGACPHASLFKNPTEILNPGKTI